jgi:hypothetical protein
VERRTREALVMLRLAARVEALRGSTIKDQLKQGE